MKKRPIYKLITAITVFMLLSCESDIVIDLPAPDTKVVVDGSIENGEFCKVAVTKTAPYFSTISISALSSIFIMDASVYLTDGTLTDTLQLTFDNTQFPPIYYGGTNPALKGQVGKSYQLTVIALGDTLTAQTTIPGLVQVDSVTWKPFGTNDSLGLGWFYFKDPDTLGNYYNLLCKRQEYPYYVPAPGQAISSDQLVNGQYIEFTFARPAATPAWFNAATNDTIGGEQNGTGLYKRGDTIYVKFCSIDYNSFEFLRTYTSAAGSFGNPFSAPTFVQSNINGGLGGFVGLAASYKSYIVP